VHKDKAQPFCSVQDQIHWGILFLTRQLRNFSRQEREQCLQEVREEARQRSNLLCLQIIRAYREYCKKGGPTYLRHRAWLWSNRDNPEFRAEWERRFPRSEAEGTAESIRVKLEPSWPRNLTSRRSSRRR
jgi:hypothetical protein